MSRNIFSVSSLVHYLKESIDHDMNLQSILIKGEVSNFTNHRSGHWYFSIKDKKAKINCVMFSSYACKVKFLLKEGMQIIVEGSLSVYEMQGSVQVYVVKVQQDGLGDLFLRLEETKQKLAAEGLFESAHKQAIPLYPQRIALITAKEGAAIHDMRQTILRRWPIAEILFYPSLVQGNEAPKQLIENLKKADEAHPDVILLARGGGSIEDLWAFQDETLARCIYDLESVVISGVGHESDTTLVDYVSDARAATPTAAAELATPDIYEVMEKIANLKRQMYALMKTKLDRQEQQLKRMKQTRYLHDPLSYLHDKQLQLAMYAKAMEQLSNVLQNHRFDLHAKQLWLQHQSRAMYQAMYARYKQQEHAFLQAMKQFQTKQNQQFQQFASLLDAYSPLKVLSRGYSVLYKNDHVIQSIQEVRENDEVNIRMHDGKIQACVIHKEEL